MVPPKVLLNARGIVRVLIASSVALLIMSVATRFLALSHTDEYVQRLSGLFYADAEGNFPTFFSVGLLLIAALLLSFITRSEVMRGTSYASHWMTLSIGFFLMATDEAVSVHEKFVRPIKGLLGNVESFGPFYFIWVVPALIMVAVLAVFFVKFLWQLPVGTRASFLGAATLYLGGAIGIEMVEGSFVERVGTENFLFSALTTIEEGLEMAGLIVFIRALFAHISVEYGEVRIVFT